MKLTSLFLLLLCLVSHVSHARQSCDWPFRTTINITEQSGTNLSDYQIKLEVSGSNLHADYIWTVDGYDFRVFDSDDTTALEFWVESWDQGSETATIWVRFPSTAPLLANQTRSIYLYYGNENAAPLANVPFTFIEPGIKFHARNTNYNPTNKSQAFNEFDSIADSGNNNDGYGCTFITDFTNVTKNGTFGNGADFAALSESYFEVKASEEGLWEFRYGADFGRGGALYVDDVALEEDWSNDLWWAYDWNNADVLQGSISLTEGYHKLEVIGFEGCCDGGITVQFKRPGGVWTTFTTSDIDIRSRACPVADPLVSFGSHDTCDLVDLRIRNNGLSIPDPWEINVPSTISFALRNTPNGDDPSANPIPVEISLPFGFQLNSTSGTDWSCAQTGTTIDCTFNQSLNRSSNSNSVSLQITPDITSITGTNAITIQVNPTYYDVNRGNNSVNPSFTLEDNNAIAAVVPSCGTPDTGIWARFFDIQTYSDSNLQNEAEMQAIVDDRVNVTYVDGQSILSNIDGSSNPFDDRGDEYYLTVLEGYLNIPSTDYYTFGVDGDDAVEFRLNDSVVSAFYGLHGPNGSPVDNQTIRLAAGYHKIEYRMQEYTGGAVFDLYWNPPFSGQSIVPASYFFHCAGDPNLSLVTNLTVVNDPINGTNFPKAIPGAVIHQTVVGTNLGKISTDLDSTIITQAISDDNQLYVGDLLGGSGPIYFIDNASPNESGVTYSFTALSSTTDSLSFSDNNGATFDYVPVPDSDGYDANITHFRVSFSGSFKPKFDTNQPGFEFTYQVLVH